MPFFVRGPGIAPGSASDALISVVDIGPTILHLAGVQWGSSWPADGRSFAPVLLQQPPPATGGTEAARDPPPPGWRDRVLISFTGWTDYEYLRPCDFGQLPAVDCANATIANVSGLINAQSNTYSALRIVNTTHRLTYAEYRAQGSPRARSSTNWTELYNVTDDPFEMRNLADGGPISRALSQELWAVATCVGTACP